MIPHPINEQKNFISGWYIDEEVCDRFIEDFEFDPNSHFVAHSARGYKYIPSADVRVELVTDYEMILDEVINEYIKEYPYSKESLCSWTMDFPFNVQKYDPGNFYSVWHCENNGQPQYRTRHLAFMTYLNTVDDGGETEFLHQNVKIKPEKGLTLVWPAYFTHIHKGLPSPTQEKYITTGWYKFFDTETFLADNLEVSPEDFFKHLDQITRNVK